MSAQKIKTIEELKPKMLANAIEIAKDFNVNLDYSDESINGVEHVLSELHKEYKKTKSDEGLHGIALFYAFYIVAVIEKNHGKGKFERNHKTFGENSFPFTWNGKTLFPYGWCEKRILDGEGDNVEIKYKMLILNAN